MNRIWANRLEAGTKTWEQVPMTRRSGVKAVLAEDVDAGVITAAEYESITGEPYEA